MFLFRERGKWTDKGGGEMERIRGKTEARAQGKEGRGRAKGEREEEKVEQGKGHRGREKGERMKGKEGKRNERGSDGRRHP